MRFLKAGSVLLISGLSSPNLVPGREKVLYSCLMNRWVCKWLWWEETQQLEFSIQKLLSLPYAFLFGMPFVKIMIHLGQMEKYSANSWGQSYWAGSCCLLEEGGSLSWDWVRLSKAFTHQNSFLYLGSRSIFGKGLDSKHFQHCGPYGLWHCCHIMTAAVDL